MLVVTVMSLLTGSARPDSVAGVVVTARVVLETAVAVFTATASVLTPSASLASKSDCCTVLWTVQDPDALCPGSIAPVMTPAVPQSVKLMALSVLASVTLESPTVPVLRIDTVQSMVPLAVNAQGRQQAENKQTSQHA